LWKKLVDPEAEEEAAGEEVREGDWFTTLVIVIV
jgi:hypothetical protein